MKKIILLFTLIGINFGLEAQITDTGSNVGIGITTPKSKLDIGTNYSNPSVYPNKITLWSGGENNYFGFGISNGDLDYFSQHNHRFYTEYNGTPGSEKMVIKSNGNVGVGTTNPKEKFHLEGNLLLDTYSLGNNNGIFFRENFSATNKYNLSILAYDHSNSGASPDGLSLNAYDGISFSTGSSSRNEKMRIDKNGNVGIGTSTPVSLLDVNGDGKIGSLNSRHYLRIASKTFPEIRFQTPSSDRQMRLGVASANYSNYGLSEGDFYVYTATTSTMPLVVNKNGNVSLVNKFGNVGIGTTSPDAKLAVNGKIHTKEVKVDLIGWPDYVFYDNYKLPTLQEVETHIKEKGHLKDIPSAKEVEKNGILLGDMNAKLLQKIEELTLYTIEQEKELQHSKKTVKKLEAKSETLESRLEKLETIIKELER